MTAYAIDLEAGSQKRSTSNGQPQKVPRNHKASSLPDPLSHLVPAKDDLSGSSATLSCEETQAHPPHTDLKSKASCDLPRIQHRQRLLQLSKGDFKKNHSKINDRTPGERTIVIPKPCETRTKKGEEYSQPRLANAEKVKAIAISKPDKTNRNADHIDTFSVDREYRGEISNHTTFVLGHAEQTLLRLSETDRSQRVSSSDTISNALPPIPDQHATVVQRNGSLPTPPDSDTGLDYTSRSKATGSNRSDRIPSYHFVSVPESPSENSSSPTRKSLSSQVTSISACSTVEQQSKTLYPFFEEDTVTTSSGVNQTVKAPGYGLNLETVSSTTEKPLLNLVWRDVGNGISRAYPRHEIPLLLSPVLPSTLTNLTEGLDYFVYSDGDTTISQGSHAEHKDADNTPDSQDWLFFDDDDLQVLLEPRSDHREPLEVFSSDLESDTDMVDVAPIRRATALPKHTFVPAPRLIAAKFHFTSIPSVPPTTSTSNAQTTHNLDDYVPSNVQPAHLTPSRLLSPSNIPVRSVKIEQYNPNTSSGFSDTDVGTGRDKSLRNGGGRHSVTAHTRRKHKRRHKRKKRHELTAKIKSPCAEPVSFTRVAVLRAAERLKSLLDWK